MKTNPNWPVGHVTRLDDGYDWTVHAATEHFTALVRPITDNDVEEWADWREEQGLERDEHLVGTLQYTVVDWRNGVRGPCNLSGWGWGDGTYTREQCAAMLVGFEAGDLEVSRRSRVLI